SVKFKTTIDKGIHRATYFQNSNNKFFIANLKELHLLNTQKALQILAIKFEPPIVKPRRKERDTCLFQVIHSFEHLAQFWSRYDNFEFAAKIIARLEKRWE
ncbi:8360_t:CDS:2, partial [Diversispora eburnea]